MKSRKSYCTTPGVSVVGGGGVSKMLKFYVKVFYVMGKVLSGKLSCPVTGLVASLLKGVVGWCDGPG